MITMQEAIAEAPIPERARIPSVSVVAPKPEEIAGSVVQLCGDAEALDIDSPEMLDHAAGIVRNIRARKKALEDKRFEFTRPLDALKAKFSEAFRPSIDALERAEAGIKRKAIAFTAEQDRLDRERRAAAEEAARKERERLAKEADKLEAKGKIEQAEAKRDIAAAIPTALEMPAMQPAKGGITYRSKWRGNVTDFGALVRCIAARPEYHSLLAPSQSEIDRLAGVLKKNLNLDGLEIVEEKIAVAPR